MGRLQFSHAKVEVAGVVGVEEELFGAVGAAVEEDVLQFVRGINNPATLCAPHCFLIQSVCICATEAQGTFCNARNDRSRQLSCTS